MSIVVVALFCAITEFICYGGNWLLAQNMADQPIVVGPLIGLLLGHPVEGLVLGAALEALFIGAINVGGAISMNPSFGTVLAIAFAILSNGGEKFAIAIAIPLGLLGGLLEISVNILMSFVCPALDRAAEKGDERQLVFIHLGGWLLKMLILSATVFIVVLAGAGPVTLFVKHLPNFIIGGMSVVAGLLPAVGFAILLNMIWSPRLSVYYIFGFICVIYLKLPLFVVAILGIILAVVISGIDLDILKIKGSAGNSAQSEENEEEDFLS